MHIDLQGRARALSSASNLAQCKIGVNGDLGNGLCGIASHPRYRFGQGRRAGATPSGPRAGGDADFTYSGLDAAAAPPLPQSATRSRGGSGTRQGMAARLLEASAAAVVDLGAV